MPFPKCCVCPVTAREPRTKTRCASLAGVPAYLAPSAGCLRRNAEFLRSQHRGPGQKPGAALCCRHGLSQVPSQPWVLPAPRTRSPGPRGRPASEHSSEPSWAASCCSSFSIPRHAALRDPQLKSLPSTVSLEPFPKYSCPVFAQPWGPGRKPRLPRRGAQRVQRPLPGGPGFRGSSRPSSPPSLLPGAIVLPSTVSLVPGPKCCSV